VPRLHAILIRKQVSAVPVLSPDLATVAAQLPALRLTALELLAEAVGGDRLVAEYLLLQLVSRRAPTAHGLLYEGCEGVFRLGGGTAWSQAPAARAASGVCPRSSMSD